MLVPTRRRPARAAGLREDDDRAGNADRPEDSHAHSPPASYFAGHRPPAPSLFGELIEYASTRDAPFEDPDGGFGTRIVRPAGKGWRISDYSHERRTTWTRRRAVILKRPHRRRSDKAR